MLIHVDTPHGPARAQLTVPEGAPAALLLGHGAGGGVSAPDLLAAAGAAHAAGWATALVEQPYRVAGRRSAPRAPVLDEGWRAVCAALGADVLRGLPLVCGGRSSGARVACRTAADVGSVGVLCLAFPLQPPPRRDGSPSPSRQDELEQPAVPVLVVQGARDRFGMPATGPGREVVQVQADHGLKSDLDTLRAAVAAWLPRVVGS